MGQRITIDQIGALTQNAGTVTLAASRLTIGGQQYKTAALQLVLPALTANSLYMLYVVISGGTPTLVQSTNVNSVGPAGFTAWKLVGAYYANGLSSVAFGAFVNIEGVPQVDGIPFVPTGAWNTNTTYSGFWGRKGGVAVMAYQALLSGAPNNTQLFFNPFANSTVDTAKMTSSPGSANRSWIMHGFDASTTLSYGITLDFVGGAFYTGYPSATTGQKNGTSAANPITWASGDYISGQVNEVPIVGWSNTPLKDL